MPDTAVLRDQGMPLAAEQAPALPAPQLTAEQAHAPPAPQLAAGHEWPGHEWASAGRGEFSINRAALLGHGGYGACYKGFFKGAPVAIKQLLKPRVKQKLGQTRARAESAAAKEHAEREQRFFQEARLQVQCRHPHVCAVFAVCGEPEAASIILEQCLCSLHTALKRSESDKWPQYSQWREWRGRLQLAREAALALAHIHSRHPEGVLHNDLRADNCLVSGDGTLKLADFGLSTPAAPAPGAPAHVPPVPSARVRFDRGVTGARQWVAPEVFVEHHAGDGEVLLSSATDIWALGVVLWEILVGAQREPLHQLRQVLTRDGRLMKWKDHELMSRVQSLALGELKDAGARNAQELLRLPADGEPLQPAGSEVLPADLHILLDGLVASCCSMDAAQRPSAADVAQQLEDVVELLKSREDS